ncbi:beta/gamma crystallin domain-containing protein [Streptomyces sp. BE20]|uniref:beta/gamma crystallin domain-containing protein n=1 Tax=unclassified Streptomyces TaxID=2593676 RepID=UPI002E78BE53|nr:MULTISPECIES: beta/gamma crystallin domain-containing protein [unclassified Streptomyces]MED7948857.1 beta/gamma crystallin domain-containing protein [Streptomyces sp. BE303]MEE1822967.1 beta/gamma crystallin domain-containing protein [Streptomyces sp. BE20]
MVSGKMKAVRLLTSALAAAGVFTLVGPSGNAFAGNVSCESGNDFLKIWSHGSRFGDVNCFANAGVYKVDGWVDRVFTGNNDINMYDYNGATVRVNRWYDISYPNRPLHIWKVEIL